MKTFKTFLNEVWDTIQQKYPEMDKHHRDEVYKHAEKLVKEKGIKQLHSIGTGAVFEKKGELYSSLLDDQLNGHSIHTKPNGKGGFETTITTRTRNE